MTARDLKPFWNYYGGKWRAAARYPKPEHSTIVEPFAGAAGYSMHYSDLDVVLVEVYPKVAQVWDYLTSVTASEVRRIPLVEHVDDLPARVPSGARSLVGFCLNNGSASPKRSLSAGLRGLAARGRTMVGWCEGRRERVAAQVSQVRHWTVVQGDYSDAPDTKATWFVDPPYQGRPGSHYIHGSDRIDYASLAYFCRSRSGQVIACEAEGAAWLPFEPLASIKAGPARARSCEAVWTS